MNDKHQGRPMRRVEPFAQGTLRAPDGRPVCAVSRHDAAPSDGRALKAASETLNDGSPLYAVSYYDGSLVTPDGRPVHAMQLHDSGGVPISTAGPMKTLVMVGTSTNTAPPNNAVRYTPLAGGATINAMWQSASSRPDTPCPVAGTFSTLWVRLPVALTLTQTWTFNLVVNGVDTGLTVTFNSSSAAHPSGGQFLSVSTPVAVNKGDTVCLKSNPANTPAAQTIIQFGLLFTATTYQASPMFCAWSAQGAGTGWGTPLTLNSGLQQESSRRCYMPTAGSFRNIMIGTNNAPGGSETRTVTLVVNGVDQATATISGAGTTGSWSGNVHVRAGDLVQLRRDHSAGAVSGLVFCGIDWWPDNAGEQLLLCPGTGSFASTGTIFQNFQGCAENTEATESNVYTPIAAPATLTKLRFDLGSAPGAAASGKKRDFTIRKNALNTAAAATALETATSCSWSGSLALATGDLMDWSEVPTNTPSASNPISMSGVLVVS